METKVPATFCPTEASKKQTEFCHSYGLPLFAPKNGICFKCGRNIYMPYTQGSGEWVFTTGIKLENAGEYHITSCPHCNKSYCD